MKPAGLVTGIAFLLAATAAISRDAASPFDVKLPADRQALHVLNRMAYGPRPGDVEAVRRMGVKEWIRRQMDPAKVPENPALEAIIKPMVTQELPSWKLIETTQPPRVQVNLNMPSVMQLVPGEKGLKLSSSSTPPEKQGILKSLTTGSAQPGAAADAAAIVEGLPSSGRKRTSRQMRTEMMSRQVQEMQRRNNPPLSELFTPDQLNILRRGTDDEKIALLAPFDEAKRMQVFRAMGPQGTQLLPPVYRRQAALLSNAQQALSSFTK